MDRNARLMNDFIRQKGRRPAFEAAASGPPVEDLAHWIATGQTARQPQPPVNHGSADGGAGQGQRPVKDPAQIMNAAILAAFRGAL